MRKSRKSDSHLDLITTSSSPSTDAQDIIADLRGAIYELKEVLAGKKQLSTLDNLIDEL